MIKLKLLKSNHDLRDSVEVNIPKLSVILPVNRDDGYFFSAVESILKQSFKDFELLILANNCDDLLWNNIVEYSKKDPRIKPIRLSLGGLTFSLNCGLNEACGEYIARMDADDLSYPHRFAKQVKFLDENPQVIVLGAQINYIDKEGRIIPENAARLPLDTHSLRKISYWKCPLYHPTVMFRKEKILKIGGYKFGFYGEDYELWLRAIHEKYELANLDEVLLDYRMHDGQLSSVAFEKNIYIGQILKTYLKKHEDYKYLLGLLVQSSIIQFLISKTFKLRNRIKK